MVAPAAAGVQARIAAGPLLARGAFGAITGAERRLGVFLAYIWARAAMCGAAAVRRRMAPRARVAPAPAHAPRLGRRGAPAYCRCCCPPSLSLLYAAAVRPGYNVVTTTQGPSSGPAQRAREPLLGTALCSLPAARAPPERVLWVSLPSDGRGAAIKLASIGSTGPQHEGAAGARGAGRARAQRRLPILIPAAGPRAAPATLWSGGGGARGRARGGREGRGLNARGARPRPGAPGYGSFVAERGRRRGAARRAPAGRARGELGSGPRGPLPWRAPRAAPAAAEWGPRAGARRGGARARLAARAGPARRGVAGGAQAAVLGARRERWRGPEGAAGHVHRAVSLVVSTHRAGGGIRRHARRGGPGGGPSSQGVRAAGAGGCPAPRGRGPPCNKRLARGAGFAQRCSAACRGRGGGRIHNTAGAAGGVTHKGSSRLRRVAPPAGRPAAQRERGACHGFGAAAARAPGRGRGLRAPARAARRKGYRRGAPGGRTRDTRGYSPGEQARGLAHRNSTPACAARGGAGGGRGRAGRAGRGIKIGEAARWRAHLGARAAGRTRLVCAGGGPGPRPRGPKKCPARAQGTGAGRCTGARGRAACGWRRRGRGAARVGGTKTPRRGAGARL
jgi:hypothetical protein